MYSTLCTPCVVLVLMLVLSEQVALGSRRLNAEEKQQRRAELRAKRQRQSRRTSGGPHGSQDDERVDDGHFEGHVTDTSRPLWSYEQDEVRTHPRRRNHNRRNRNKGSPRSEASAVFLQEDGSPMSVTEQDTGADAGVESSMETMQTEGSNDTQQSAARWMIQERLVMNCLIYMRKSLQYITKKHSCIIHTHILNMNSLFRHFSENLMKHFFTNIFAFENILSIH